MVSVSGWWFVRQSLRQQKNLHKFTYKNLNSKMAQMPKMAQCQNGSNFEMVQMSKSGYRADKPAAATAGS